MAIWSPGAHYCVSSTRTRIPQLNNAFLTCYALDCASFGHCKSKRLFQRGDRGLTHIIYKCRFPPIIRPPTWFVNRVTPHHALSTASPSELLKSKLLTTHRTISRLDYSDQKRWVSTEATVLSPTRLVSATGKRSLTPFSLALKTLALLKTSRLLSNSVCNT